MRQLHTLRLSSIFLAETYLYCILSSPHLTHLILCAIQMPKMSRFPPPNPNLRRLTLKLMVSWDLVRPLIVHLATTLEHLEFCSGSICGPRNRPHLPPFPSLRELHHYQVYGYGTVLDELFHVSQITRLHLFGTLSSSNTHALPRSLRHLSTEDGILTQQVLGTTPLVQLVSLSIRRYTSPDASHHLKISAFVYDHFPRITSLRLDIQWSLRNTALMMARSQRNVRAMELSIETMHCLDSGERDQVEIPNDHLRNKMLLGALQSLRLNVVQCGGELELSLSQCSQWIYDDILHPVTGLGGSDLKSIDVSFVQPKAGSERERRIWKRWVKLPDVGWRMEGTVCDNRDTNAAFIATLMTS